MTTWETPSKRRRPLRRKLTELSGWQSRLLAGLVAPFVFNLALFLLLASLKSMHRGFGLWTLTPGALLIALAVVPFAVGVAAGMGRLTALLGHTFWTHPEDERSLVVTASIWIVLGLFATVVHQ